MLLHSHWPSVISVYIHQRKCQFHESAPIQLCNAKLTPDAQLILQLYHVYHTTYLTEDIQLRNEVSNKHITNTTEVLRQKTLWSTSKHPLLHLATNILHTSQADMETLLLYHDCAYANGFPSLAEGLHDTQNSTHCRMEGEGLEHRTWM
jgi:hypothetical protein